MHRCTCLAAEPTTRLYAGAAMQVLVYDVTSGQVVHTQVTPAPAKALPGRLPVSACTAVATNHGPHHQLALTHPRGRRLPLLQGGHAANVVAVAIFSGFLISASEDGRVGLFSMDGSNKTLELKAPASLTAMLTSVVNKKETMVRATPTR